MPILRRQGGLPTLLALIGCQGFSVSVAIAQSVPAEFHGYLRAGAVMSSCGGDQVAFQLPGTPAKYRLGNESDDYGEFQVDSPIYKDPESGGAFAFHGMLAVANRGNTLSGAQYWIEGSRLVQGPFEGARFWVGKRYYQRQDVHISDFFFWNNSGTGGGVEDINVGIGKLHYAYILTRIGNRPEYPTTTHEGDSVGSHDLRLSGLNVNPGGELTLGVDIKDALPRKQSVSDNNRHGGLWLNLLHDQKGILGGSNRLAIQWGNGAAAVLANPPDPSLDNDVRAWRVVEALTVQPTPAWSGQFEGVREVREDATGRTTWSSLGGRPIWHFARHGSLALEVGHDRVCPPIGDTRTLTKATLALQLAKGPSFYARPVFRLFITRAKWNTAAQEAAPLNSVLSASGPFGSKLQGTTFGIQVEGWW